MKRWTVVLLIVVTGTTGCGREPTGREGASELRRPTVEPVPLELGQEVEPHAPPASSSPEAISESTVTTQRRITIVQSAGTDAEVEELRRQVGELKTQVDALQRQVGRVSVLSSSTGPLEERVGVLEEQVGVRSVRRESVTDLWSKAAAADDCLDQIVRGWRSEYPPRC